jgi:hypothetical protein
MKGRVACNVLFLANSLVLPHTASGQNVSAATAQNVVAGQSPWFFEISNAVPVRWYVFTARQGRSYCVEMMADPHYENGVNGPADTGVTLYRANGTTVIGANDDAVDEPLSGRNFATQEGNFGLSRFCFEAPGSEHVFLAATGFNASTNFYAARVVETTLFSNWFFVGGDYHAYTLLRNTTSTPANFRVNWRNSAGTIVESFTGVLGPNGSTFVDARSFSSLVAAGSGTVEIVHDRSPDALVASSTILSVTTGLSFDSPFLRRTPW